MKSAGIWRIFMGNAMDREALIAELQRLEKYGFYVIEEAYELANRMDLTALSGMPLPTAALEVSQKAIELKFKQQSPALAGTNKTLEQHPY
jgi:2-oxo-4-hydroxy-4-carboxy--5-ureidoimidazoline (OHCU) decarboxylase